MTADWKWARGACLVKDGTGRGLGASGSILGCLAIQSSPCDEKGLWPLEAAGWGGKRQR